MPNSGTNRGSQSWERPEASVADLRRRSEGKERGGEGRTGRSGRKGWKIMEGAHGGSSETRDQMVSRSGYKTSKSCGAKKFFRTERAVGLLSWLEGMEYVLYIRKCSAITKSRLNLMKHTSLDKREILKVHRERPEGNLKQLKTVKVNELKLEDIPILRNFPNVFPEDISSLPPSREVEFPINLIPRAMPVAKSPYRLAPTKMQEWSNHLKELKDKGFI
ncbi:hypothetical protein Tco_0991688 [Tanacetum coccineum]|uniref:Reverse transcriptase domain-containing protein n=1 Tax=Tanacetum coccineum TaxID=301880 RepID=A0ABQ5F0Q9_9ASTR